MMTPPQDLTALRASEERFQKAFRHAPVMMLITLLEDGTLLDVNLLFETLSGYSREEALGKTTVELGFISEEDRARLVRAMRGDGCVSGLELRCRIKDGSYVECVYGGQPILVGSRPCILSLVTDVTERKRFEAEREKMIRLLRLLNAPSDIHGLTREAVRFLKEWSGCEAVGIRLRDGDRLPFFETEGLPPETVQAAGQLSVTDSECICASVFLGRPNHGSPCITEGGSFWTNHAGGAPELAIGGSPLGRAGDCCRSRRDESVAVIPLKSGGQVLGLLELSDSQRGRFTAESVALFERAAASLAIALDQRLGQEALRRSEERYRLIADNTGDVIWIMDLATGLYTYMSPSAERVGGYTPEELSGCDWRRPLTPESGERLAALLPARVAAFEAGDESARVGVHEVGLVRKDGTVTTAEVVTTLLADEAGRASQLIGVTRDITGRKRAEEEREALQLQLLHSQKMESIGRLAGGIAHDFNNLLTIINGYAAMTLSRMHVADPVRPAIEEIRKAGERAEGLVRQLLAFSRKQVLEPQTLSLNTVVGGMESMIRRLVGEDVHIVTRLAPSLPPLLADRQQIEQVIMNLVVNARDAMPRGGQLTLETSRRDLGGASPICRGPVRPGPYLELAVHDTGTGMNEEVRQRLFEPFFTTKEPGKGTGLGLAMVQGIVSQSGGHIGVESQLGRGSCFRIYLPIAEGTRESAAPGAARILVVDDEEGVRGFLRTVLEVAGYDVLEAADGKQALLVVQAAPVDLVITDLVMPEQEGIETVRALRRDYPSVGIIVISGAAGGPYLRVAETLGAHAALPKPVAPEVLLAEVGTVLQSRTR